MPKPTVLQGKRISNHKRKPSFWRKHPLITASLALALLSIPLSSLLPSLTSTSLLASPLRVVTLLWYRLQWALFTDAKDRLQIHDIFNISSVESTPLNSSLIKSVDWDSSVVDKVINEGNDVIQSFFVADIVTAGDPVVIRRGPASYWGLCEWDMAAQIVQGRDVVLEGVRWQSQPKHTLTREREKGGMLGSAKSNKGLVASLDQTLSKFLEALFHPASYMSWQGEVALMEQVLDFAPTTHTLHSSVEGSQAERLLDWTFLQVVEEALMEDYEKELLRKKSDGAERYWSSFVTLSHPGVVWTTAYEPQHKFLSQVQGSSSITLFPPEDPMYTFPDIHRSHRQSQIPFDELPTTSANISELQHLLDKLGYADHGSDVLSVEKEFPGLPVGASVSLLPGDTLYIPPYWHFRSQADTLSMTLEVNSPTTAESLLAEVYAQPTPLNIFANHSEEGRLFSSKLFLGLLLSELSSSIPGLTSDLNTFARGIYNQRYRSLYPPGSLEASRNSTLNPKGLKSMTFCPGFPSESSELGVLLESLKDGMYRSVKRVAALFIQEGRAYTDKQVNVHSMSDSDEKLEFSGEISPRAGAVVIRTLGDYMEKVVRFAVGPQKTVYFIHDCLN